MEKIQSAIAKARAERNSQTAQMPPAARPPQPGPAAAGPAVPSQADQLWQALPETPLDAHHLQSQRIASFAGGRDAAAFDVMRTRVLQQMRANGWKRLAITSPSPACGKSTVATNLIFSLSRQPDLRSILMEIDMRRPSIARILGIKPQRGLSDVLNGTAGFSDCALRYGSGLAIAANTGSVSNPAELLSGPRPPAVIAAIEADYAPDIMIFDMPPMLVSDDVMAFMGQVDAVLLIAAAESTTIQEVDACERELAAQTNVMGVVLNKCRYAGSEYGYGYGYYE